MIWKLLIAFQIKHFICDYPLQFGIMLDKFKPTGWIKGLAIHSGIHAIATFLILTKLTNISIFVSIGLALLDFVLHFGMDRLKASPNLLGRFKPIIDPATFVKANKYDKLGNSLFWYSLGLDQLVHHFTHYLIIFLALKGM